jgi:hypothetical protein
MMLFIRNFPYDLFLSGLRMRMRTIIIIPALLFLCACKVEVQLNDTDALAAELLQADQDFAALSESTTPKTAFAAFMAPDGMMLP